SSPESPAIGLAARGRHHQQRALAVSIAAIEPMLSEIEYAGHLTTGSPSCLHQVSIDNAVLSIPVRWGFPQIRRSLGLSWPILLRDLMRRSEWPPGPSPWPLRPRDCEEEPGFATPAEAGKRPRRSGRRLPETAPGSRAKVD